MATTFGLQERLIYSGTVDPETLLIHKSRFQAVEIFLNLENLIPDFYGKTIPAPSKDFFSQDHSLEISQVAELAKRYPYQALNMHYGLWNEAVAQLAQAKGLHFSLWTIDDEDLLRSLITQGVYAITTRNLQLALNIRAEFDQ